jgi:hypothetical protein
MMNIEKFDKTKTYTRHAKCHPQGGVFLKDEEGSTVNARDVLLNLLKSVGSKLKEGKILDLLKISRPAVLSAPRTYLECIAGDLAQTKFLDKAAATDDPVLRLKYVIAFTMAGLHRNTTELGNSGPLNPVLGETYRAEKRDGTKLFCEQITHHPPVSAFLMDHPTGAYRLYGTGEVTAKMTGLNTINGQKIGDTVIAFKNGHKIVIGNPEMRIDGLVMGERIINYMRSFTITDEKHRLAAQVNFNYEEVGTLSKLTSSFKGLFGGSAKPEKPLNDTFTISLYTFTKQKENGEVEKAEICSGSGSWLSHLEIEGELYWRVTDSIEDAWIPVENKKLDSDSTNRQDSKYIKEKNYDKAQKEKDLLENIQRNDAKLRKGKH